MLFGWSGTSGDSPSAASSPVKSRLRACQSPAGISPADQNARASSWLASSLCLVAGKAGLRGRRRCRCARRPRPATHPPGRRAPRRRDDLPFQPGPGELIAQAVEAQVEALVAKRLPAVDGNAMRGQCRPASYRAGFLPWDLTGHHGSVTVKQGSILPGSGCPCLSSRSLASQRRVSRPGA